MVEGILDRSREVLATERPDLLDALEPLMDAADAGNRHALDVFIRAVAGPGGVDERLLAKLLAGLVSASPTGLPPRRFDPKQITPVGDIKLPPDMTEMTALKRVVSEDFEFTKRTPAEIDVEVFKGIEYAKEARVNQEIPITTGDKVMMALAERVGRFTIDAFRAARENGVEIPPPPTSEAYDEILVKMVGFEPDVLAAWKSWTHWKSVLAYQFVGILTNDITYSRDPVERLERAIDSKDKWYEALAMFGLEDADIERAFARFYKNAGGYDDVRALGELRRFAKPEDESLMQNPAAAGQLGAAVMALHKADPSLGQDRFMELLPHYAYPMTMESCLAMLGRENPGFNGFYLFKARAILAWHMDPSTEQIDSLSSIVRQAGRKFKELDSFCRQMLGVRTLDLLDKIADLARQGYYPEPLALEIQDAFPRQVEFDLDAMRKAAEGAEGEAEFAGIARSPKAHGGEEDGGAAAGVESADAAAAQSIKAAEQLALSFAVVATPVKTKA